MTDDTLLLQRFARDRDEAAFAELVGRHLGLVYSVALRTVGGDAHLAQDVAQSVFIDLARKAPALGDRTVLVGWLHTSTHYAAAKAVRTEQRRRARKEVAQTMQQDFDDTPPVAWDRIRPVLDPALQQLGRTDRDALLLRFFEGCGFADLGARLGLTESGARMRVERALEKLRLQLARRGITSTAAALGTALAAQAVTAPPAGLAAAITGPALAATAGGGALAGLSVFLGMTKTHVAIMAGVALAGAAVVGVQHQETRRLEAALAASVESPRHTAAAGDPAAGAPAGSARRATAAAEDDVRIAALRRETAALRARLRELAIARLAATAPRRPAGTPRVTGPVVPVDELDVKPQVVSAQQPKYPPELQRAGIPGETILSLTIDTEGNVVDVQPDEATHPDFALAALDALGSWKFRPGKKDGQAVNVTMVLPLRFMLADTNWF